MPTDTLAEFLESLDLMDHGERLEALEYASAAAAPVNCRECSAPLWSARDYSYNDAERLCVECEALERLEMEDSDNA